MIPVFSIFRGDNKTLYLKALQGGCADSDPLDLSACTEIDIALPKSDGTFLHLLLSLSQVTVTAPAVLGKFSAPISALNSALLNVGEFQDFVVTFTIAGVKFSVRYQRSLSVFQ